MLLAGSLSELRRCLNPLPSTPTGGDDGISQVPRQPLCEHALLFDPGGPDAPRPLTAHPMLPFTRLTASAPRLRRCRSSNLNLSGGSAERHFKTNSNAGPGRSGCQPASSAFTMQFATCAGVTPTGALPMTFDGWMLPKWTTSVLPVPSARATAMFTPVIATACAYVGLDRTFQRKRRLATVIAREPLSPIMKSVALFGALHAMRASRQCNVLRTNLHHNEHDANGCATYDEWPQ